LAGGLFLVGGIALAGVPPTNGFISKLVLFKSGLEVQAFAALAVIGAASVLSLIYVLRAFMRIWWEMPPSGVKTKPDGDRLIAPALLVSGCVVFGLWSEPLISLSMRIVNWMGEPGRYIQAVFGG
jgi:formate hydrogenlyase subunit 3/multisubunit Na+/H+ antiporter MnhD subunit